MALTGQYLIRYLRDAANPKFDMQNRAYPKDKPDSVFYLDLFSASGFAVPSFAIVTVSDADSLGLFGSR